MTKGSESKETKASQSRATAMGLRFWRQAQRDLEAARLLVAPRTAYAAAYMAEQAAEKALKGAYWHLLQEEPPRKHHLGGPAGRLAQKAGIVPPEVEQAITVIMPLFERGRYLSLDDDERIPAELIGEKDAGLAVKSAETVMAWAEMLLQQQLGKPE